MKPTDAPAPFPEVFRGLIFSLYLPSFLMSMSQGIVLLMIPLYALELDNNAGLAALVFSLRGLGNAVSDIPAGSIASRIGDKVAMLIGVGAMAATALLAGFAASSLELAICAFLFGIAMGTWLIGRLTHVAESVHVSHRGKAIATMAGLQRFGNFVGPVVSGILATQYGFPVVFWLVAALALAALLMVIVTVTNHRSAVTGEDHSILRVVPHIIRTNIAVFRTAGVAMLILTMIRASRQLVIPLWGSMLGLNPSEIGLIMGASSAIDMSMFPVAGILMDRRGRKPVAILCLTFLSLGFFIVPFADSALTLGAAAMVIGFGNGMGSGINMTLGADFSPANNRGEFMGVWRLISDSGSFAGPVAVGFIAEVFALWSAFVVAGVAGLVGVAIVGLLVSETRVTPDRLE